MNGYTSDMLQRMFLWLLLFGVILAGLSTWARSSRDQAIIKELRDQLAIERGAK